MEITGTITTDAVVADVQGTDRKVVNFTIAVNDRYVEKKTGEKKQFTNYFNCAYWLGAGVAKLLTKGSCVTVTGRLSVSPFMGKDNAPKASLKFHTDNIKVQYSKKAAGATAVAFAEATRTPSDLTEPLDDLPF